MALADSGRQGIVFTSQQRPVRASEERGGGCAAGDTSEITLYALRSRWCSMRSDGAFSDPPTSSSSPVAGRAQPRVQVLQLLPLLCCPRMSHSNY